jgi:hypothetical protein
VGNTPLQRRTLRAKGDAVLTEENGAELDAWE